MIYFMQSVDGGPVKIGFTDNLTARHRTLESHYSQRLALLAMMPGGREEEAEIHEQFSHLRLGRTEQFKPAADLMAFIGRPLLVGVNMEAVEAMNGRRYGKKIRVSEEFAEALRLAAAFAGIGIDEFADIHLLPVLRKLFRKAVMKEAKRLEGLPDPPPDPDEEPSP